VVARRSTSVSALLARALYDLVKRETSYFALASIAGSQHKGEFTWSSAFPTLSAFACSSISLWAGLAKRCRAQELLRARP
jgi:hypothetical protein